MRNDPPPPLTNNGYYTGSARANGPITCSVSCATQVAGTTTPNAPETVCPSVTLPAFSPGAADLTVTTAGFTVDATTGYDWNDITVADAVDLDGQQIFTEDPSVASAPGLPYANFNRLKSWKDQ